MKKNREFVVPRDEQVAVIPKGKPKPRPDAEKFQLCKLNDERCRKCRNRIHCN